MKACCRLQPRFEEILRFAHGLKGRFSNLTVLFFSLSQSTCKELQHTGEGLAGYRNAGQTGNFSGIYLLMETKS